MKLNCRSAVAGVLALACGAVSAESNLHTGIAMMADDQGGYARDLDFVFAPSRSWSLDAGVGSLEANSNNTSIDGQTVRAGASMRSERFGLRGYYRNYSDSSNFESDALGARASIRHGSIDWSLIAEARRSDIEYTSITAGGSNHGTAHIDAKGYGLGVAYAARGWGLYAEGVFYDSQSQLESQDVPDYTPTLLGIPIGPQTGSLMFKHGVLDLQLSAGIERGFRRSSLRVDWAGAEDAVTDARSDTFSAGFKYWFSANVHAGVTAGLTTSTLSSVKFAGASLVWRL